MIFKNRRLPFSEYLKQKPRKCKKTLDYWMYCLIWNHKTILFSHKKRIIKDHWTYYRTKGLVSVPGKN